MNQSDKDRTYLTVETEGEEHEEKEDGPEGSCWHHGDTLRVGNEGQARSCSIKTVKIRIMERGVERACQRQSELKSEICQWTRCRHRVNTEWPRQNLKRG